MSDFTITDGMKQAVITRLATINSATSILSLINGRPAKVTVDEVLALAARIESWAWRNLLNEQPAQNSDETATPQASAKSGLSTVEGPVPTHTKPAPEPPRTNGHGQHPGDATEKQINALFAIGKSKGFDSNGVTGWVKERSRKSITALTSREASKLIGDLQAL
jgi:hypothetical protein